MQLTIQITGINGGNRRADEIATNFIVAGLDVAAVAFDVRSSSITRSLERYFDDGGIGSIVLNADLALREPTEEKAAATDNASRNAESADEGDEIDTVARELGEQIAKSLGLDPDQVKMIRVG